MSFIRGEASEETMKCDINSGKRKWPDIVGVGELFDGSGYTDHGTGRFIDDLKWFRDHVFSVSLAILVVTGV